MESPNQKRTSRQVALFSLAVIVTGAIAGIIEPYTIPPDAPPKSAGLGQLLWILSPLLLMVSFRTIGGEGWSDFGFGLKVKGNGFWWLVAILIFPVAIPLCALLGYLAGGLHFDPARLPLFFEMAVTLLVPSMIKNICEEFSWRGYLAPKVYALDINIWVGHGIVGLVWGLWHIPFMFVFWPYLTVEILWLFVPLLLIGTISQSVVYGEIRLATGSVWPAWLMHTIGSVLGNALLLSGVARLVPGRELFVSPGAEGMASIVFMFAAGYGLHRKRVARRDQT